MQGAGAGEGEAEVERGVNVNVSAGWWRRPSLTTRKLLSDALDVEDSPSKFEGFHAVLTNGWSVSERDRYTSYHSCRFPSSALYQTDENFNLK